MIKRVELFSTDDLQELENQINLWLDDNDYVVVDIRFSTSSDARDPCLLIHNAVVCYEKANDFLE